MLNRRRQGTVKTENYTRPELIEAREMQAATKEMVHYEYVFYTCKSRREKIGDKIVRMGAGTNRYEFEFPGAWRTKNGKPCILGVRSIYLKQVPRMMCIQLMFQKRSNILTVDYYFKLEPSATVEEIVEMMNALIRPYDQEIAAEETEENKSRTFRWYYDVHFDDIRLNIYDGPLTWDVICNQFDPHDEEVFPYVNLPVDPDETEQMYQPSFKVKRPQELLLHADFVQQVDTQHLGYTGCEYANIKKYEIKRNTPYFSIYLFEHATMEPVELPSDGKDYVVLEVVIYNEYEVLAPTK
jgi:hypothetical protein